MQSESRKKVPARDHDMCDRMLFVTFVCGTLILVLHMAQVAWHFLLIASGFAITTC